MQNPTDFQPTSPAGELPEAIQQELRVVIRAVVRERRCPGLLQTTAIVNEAWIRLRAMDTAVRAGPDEHFAAIAASVIRSVLVDEARREARQKRGGGWRRLPISPAQPSKEGRGSTVDLVDLDGALGELGDLDRRAASVVEMRFFGGMSVEATATALGVCERSVKADWNRARAWLRVRLSDELDGKE